MLKDLVSLALFIGASLLSLHGHAFSETPDPDEPDGSDNAWPNPGKGLGNLHYEENELFQVIARIDEHSGIPAEGAPSGRHFGTNVATMVNGYLVTLFAPDSGLTGGGFLVYDVSNPRQPVLANRIYNSETAEFREAHSLGLTTIDGKTVMAISSIYGIEFWDFSNVNDISRISKIALPGVNEGDYNDVAWQLWWQAPYLYVASSNRGIFIVDTTDINNPVLADRGNGRKNPVPVSELGDFRVGSIYALGNHMLISSMDNSEALSLLDIADPLNPVLIERSKNIERYYSVCFNGNKAFASARSAGGKMVAFDVTDLNHFNVENDQLVIDDQIYCATQDHFVYQGAQNKVHKIDVSDPDNYQEVGNGTLNVPHADHGQVSPLGNVLYVGNDHGSGSGFMVHDVHADTTAPAVIQVSPRPQAVQQSLSTRVGIALSDSILLESLNSDSFSLQPILENGDLAEAVNGQFSVQLGLVNFTPDEPLTVNTHYQITLSAGGITDFAGNTLVEEFQSDFYTGMALDSLLVNRWRFENDVEDDKGANNGQDVQSHQFDEGAIVLSGDTPIILEDDVSRQLGGSASLSFYIKTGQRGNNKAYKAPGIAGGEQEGGTDDIFWGWLDGDGYLRFSLGNHSGISSLNPINNQQWAHVVLTRNAESGELAMYINGELQAHKELPSGLIGGARISKVVNSLDRPEFINQLSSAFSGLANFLGWDFALGDIPIVGFTSINLIYKCILGDCKSLATESENQLGIDLSFLNDLNNRDYGNRFRQLGAIERGGPAFQGRLDEVQIFHSALDAEQVESLFQQAVVSVDGGEPSVLELGQSMSLRVDTRNDAELRYVWNLGNGEVIETSGPTLNYTYMTTGHYPIVLSVIEANGRTQRFNLHRTIINPPTENSATSISSITGDENNIYVLNPDNGSVSAIDREQLELRWELAVGSKPRTLALGPEGNIWLTVEDDDQVLVVSPEGLLLQTISLEYGSGPYGIVFTADQSSALVTLAHRGELLKLDATNGDVLGRVSIKDPRAIAVTGDSEHAYVGQFRSGDAALVSQVALDSMTVVQDINLPADISTIDTEDSSRGLSNYLQDIVISPDGLRLLVAAKKDNIYRGIFREGEELGHDSTVRSIVDQVDLISGQLLSAEQIDFNDRAPARAIAYTPLGDYAFVALQGSNSIEIVDAYNGNQVGGIELGSLDELALAPQGLYIDEEKKRLYIHNFMSRNVSIFDISGFLNQQNIAPNFIAQLDTVTDEKMSAEILLGKQVFYNARDTRMSLDGYISCAVCHDDGGHDGQVWDFTQRGEGLRNTIDLRGRQGMAHGLVHWTANFDEIQDFENDIRNGFGGTGFLTDDEFQKTQQPLGNAKAGLSAELDALAAYVTSLKNYPRSPYRASVFTEDTIKGQQIFAQLECDSCHQGEIFSDGERHDVGSIQPSSGLGQGEYLDGIGFDTPTLLGIWDGAPYFHNGQFDTLIEVLQSGHGEADTLTTTQQEQLVVYLNSLDGQAISQ